MATGDIKILQEQADGSLKETALTKELLGAGAPFDPASPGAIGGTTPSTGAFKTLSAVAGTITANAPALNASQTWNNSGVAFGGIKLDITDTASASSSYLFRATVGGNTKFEITKSGLFRSWVGRTDTNAAFQLNGGDNGYSVWFGTYTNAGALTIRGGTGAGKGCMAPNYYVMGSGVVSWGSTSLHGYSLDTGADLFLTRDGANLLAQRNSTTAQAFRIYNTYTSSTNFERLNLRWSSNVLQIGTEKGSVGGTARGLDIQTDAVTRVAVAADGVVKIGGSTNYTQIAADGTITLAGAATVWDDLRFPAQAINPAGAAAAPAVSSSTGMLEFSGSADNTIAGQAQLPHSWKYGSEIHPHMHLLFPTANTDSSRWKLEYTIVALDGASSNAYGTYTDGGTITVANPNSASAGRLHEWSPISMTGQLGSCTLLWRITRLAASDAADTDTSAVVLTEFDIHFEMDKLGSPAETPA